MKSLFFTKSLTSLALVGAMAITPFAVFAEDGKTPRLNNSDANFCTVIANEDFKGATRWDKVSEKKDEKRDVRDDKITQVRQQIDAKRVEMMNKFLAKQGERGAKLSERPLTEEQKVALTAAQAATQSAVDVKKGDVAILVTEFRDSMDKIRGEHRADVDALIAQVKIDVDAAIAKAKADCTAGIAPETVKTNFQASMKAIRDKFETDRKALQVTTQTQVKTEVETRKTSGTEVRQTFRGSVKTAWGSFRALFQKN